MFFTTRPFRGGNITIPGGGQKRDPASRYGVEIADFDARPNQINLAIKEQATRKNEKKPKG